MILTIICRYTTHRERQLKLRYLDKTWMYVTKYLDSDLEEVSVKVALNEVALGSSPPPAITHPYYTRSAHMVFLFQDYKDEVMADDEVAIIERRVILKQMLCQVQFPYLKSLRLVNMRTAAVDGTTLSMYPSLCQDSMPRLVDVAVKDPSLINLDWLCGLSQTNVTVDVSPWWNGHEQ